MKSKFVFRFLIILICYTSLLNWNAMGAPFGRSSQIDPTSKRKPDIIAGKDFLSLFMAAASPSAKDINELENTSTIRISSKSTTIDSFEDDVTVTTIYEGDISNASTTTKHSDQIITTSTQAIHQDEKNDLITEESEQQQTVIRDSRSSNIYSYGYKNRNVEEYEDNEHPYYPALPESDEIAINTSAPAQVLSIRVSSSVGQSPSPTKLRIETSTRSQYDNYQQRPSSETPEKLMLSEQENDGAHIAAAASKSILNIDEMEPMTIDDNNPIKELHNTFKETQRQIGANPDYLEQQRFKQIQKLHPVQHHHPYHHSVVFHGQSKDGTRARSVSYSSVIQNIHPAAAERNWEQAESIERPTYLQNSHSVLNKDFQSLKIVSTSSPTPSYPQWGRLEKEVKNLEKSDSTSVLPIVYQQPEVQWGQPERNHERETTKFQNTPTSSPSYQQQEVQWGQPEVNYEQSYVPPTPTPTYSPPPVYATEEQNYEVDESVSVMTNGRTHGIQERPPQPIIPLQQGQQQSSDSQSPQQGDDQQSGVPSGDKTDNNHKVGYVVEGRNFRKYRVEERTSDGFVVGEYGVVNHDDGSLRGVRYTADGTINPRLIYDALMKFLSL
ncbi:uncharacterized protein LOC123299736 [Chrysoperla carnea]|uniref:uncharacterized protein LOC123299736 n=1 Tax=Chrysoperla carnea TaxID=189513 RepID=UPI001D08500E|nr:uncharacterized protein LOC123299736 [Chrysoperla carnea]